MRGRKKSRVVLNLMVSFQNSMTQQIPSLVAAKEVLFIWKHHEMGAQIFINATLEIKMMKWSAGFHHHFTYAFLQQPLLRKRNLASKIQVPFWDLMEYCVH